MALVFAICGLLAIGFSATLQHHASEMLTYDRKLHDRLVATGIAVESFQRKFDRLPNEAEFEAIVDRTPIIGPPLTGKSTGPYLLSARNSCGRTDQERARFDEATFIIGIFN